MINELEDALNNIRKQFIMLSASMINANAGIERVMSNLEPFSEKLIQAGWTINMRMMPSHIIEISEIIEINEIDDYYYSFFMDNKRSELINLQSECIKMLETGLAKAFDECIYAFDNHKYIICANTLLAILEGVLSKYTKDKSDIRMIKPCREQFEQTPEDHVINRMFWYVNFKFVEQLYKKSNFNEAEPSNINRNWLLHGRSSFDIREIDCLRLINTICTLCN